MVSHAPEAVDALSIDSERNPCLSRGHGDGSFPECALMALYSSSTGLLGLASFRQQVQRPYHLIKVFENYHLTM